MIIDFQFQNVTIIDTSNLKIFWAHIIFLISKHSIWIMLGMQRCDDCTRIETTHPVLALMD